MGGIKIEAEKIEIESTKNNIESIYIHTNGGTLETIKIYSELGTNDNSIEIKSEVGGIKMDARNIEIE